jgi:hypothetical protein
MRQGIGLDFTQQLTSQDGRYRILAARIRAMVAKRRSLATFSRAGPGDDRRARKT